MVQVQMPAFDRDTARARAATQPFAFYEWMLAGRYLRARRTEGVISVIAGFSLAGIALGVATLIIVMAVMNGFRQELVGKILGVQGHIMVEGASGSLDQWDTLAASIVRIPGVVRATPIAQGQVLASAPTAATGALVRGLRSSDLQAMTLVAKSLEPGALQRFQGSSSVIIGKRLADRMGLLPGMNITLLAPRGNVTPFGVTPRAKTYTIAGTFSVGMSEYDNTFIFMPLAEAQAYFNLGNAVSGIEIMIENPDDVKDWTPLVANRLTTPARIADWQQMNSTFFDALQVERNVMFLILTLIILVAALNIVSGMIMLVKDKTHDIAILRTMGAPRGAILRVFLISGSSIGILGTFIGFLLGVLFCWNIESIRQGLMWITGTNLFSPEIYFLSRMPAHMEPGEVIAVVLMALTLSILATVYPAWRAARLDPVEALRYE
jgi:lipoprotein-releasing system permease protein